MGTPEAEGKLTFGSNTSETEERLRELLLYVVQKCEDDPRFGATKLNKILFYADFYAFAHFGEPITGAQYMKLPQGPAPKHLIPALQKLEQTGALEVFTKPTFFGGHQTRFVAKRTPDLSGFSGSQLALVDEVIEHLREMTAVDVSNATHGRAWKAACDKDLIPYESIFLSDRDATDEDTRRVRELAKSFNWKERFAKYNSTNEPSRSKRQAGAGR